MMVTLKCNLGHVYLEVNTTEFKRIYSQVYVYTIATKE